MSARVLARANRDLARAEAVGLSLDERAQAEREGTIPLQEPAATAQPLPVAPPAIAHETRILDRFKEAIHGCGVVGELATAATVYLVITTRLLDRPVSVAVKGLSSSGKSFTTEKAVEFFPAEAVLRMTGMSQRALIYSPEEYAHRTIVICEATALREGAEDDMTAYTVRSLLSEGRLEYEVTERDPETKQWTVRRIVKEGPTNMVVTTTKTRLHGENETRLLSLATNDTQEQTKRIFHALASESREGPDLAEWREFQKWLQLSGERRVTIPYARRLAQLVPPVAVRLRRDFGGVLALIRAHAILHQLSREKDADGQIIATLEDYAQVRELIAPIVSDGVGATVAPIVRETVKAVEELATESGVMALKIAKRLKVDKATVSRRLRAASDAGYVVNLEAHRGKPGRWVTGDPLPDEQVLLPEPSDLEEPGGCAPVAEPIDSEGPINGGGCAVARDPEGGINSGDLEL